MRLVREQVAVRRTTTGPVSILDVLRLTSPSFDFDLRPLVFIDGLFDRDLERRASSARVRDRHVKSAQVSFKQGGIDSITRKPTCAVDSDSVKAACSWIARLRDQLQQIGSLVMAPALDVEELSRNLSVEPHNMLLAFQELRGSCKGDVLSVVGA
ncbi:MAG TPA: hypothetical protein VLJ80_00720 [Solirubrobacteraceae bacterium]|nr:hypothetical protein [Solirubrobacteraceae bacterium]